MLFLILFMVHCCANSCASCETSESLLHIGYIYIRNQSSGSVWFQYIVTPYLSVIMVKNCKNLTTRCFWRKIFEDIKWWIIVLGASPCKSIFSNHQRCVYIPLSSRSLEMNVFAYLHPAGFRGQILYLLSQPCWVLNHLYIW